MCCTDGAWLTSNTRILLCVIHFIRYEQPFAVAAAQVYGHAIGHCRGGVRRGGGNRAVLSWVSNGRGRAPADAWSSPPCCPPSCQASSCAC
jgi:hypothetical protein